MINVWASDELFTTNGTGTTLFFHLFLKQLRRQFKCPFTVLVSVIFLVAVTACQDVVFRTYLEALFAVPYRVAIFGVFQSVLCRKLMTSKTMRLAKSF
jgi:hypothetical protein